MWRKLNLKTMHYDNKHNEQTNARARNAVAVRPRMPVPALPGSVAPLQTAGAFPAQRATFPHDLYDPYGGLLLPAVTTKTKSARNEQTLRLAPGHGLDPNAGPHPARYSSS